jgi:exopolyphosphatase/pppGpp-phosphohydrolase
MKEEKKIAVLDISPNSATMLLAYSDRNGNIEIINEFGALTKLLDSMSEYNLLSSDAIKKTIDICEEMVNIANAEHVDKIIAIVSSSLRSAINKTEFLGGCHTRFNIFPYLLTPTEEYNYTYSGATIDFLETNHPIIVLEVGEATSEIIYGTKELMVDAYSLKMGSLYLSHLFKLKNSVFNKVRSPLRKYIKKTTEETTQAIRKWLKGRNPLIICTGNSATTYAGLISNDGHNNRASINEIKSNIKSARNLARKMGKMPIMAREALLGTEYHKAEFAHIGIYTISKTIANLGFREFYITTHNLKIGLIKTYIEKTKHSV